MHLKASAVLAFATILLTACGGGGMIPSAGTTLPSPDTAAAQRLISSDETLEILKFPAVGSTTTSGTIDGYRSPAYVVPVAKGQTLSVTLEGPSTNAYFNVHDAADNSGAAVFNGNSGERNARLTAPRDITYVIRPFQPRASARRNEQVRYGLTIKRK